MRGALPVLEDLPDPSGKTVLVRADLNVPLTFDEGGRSPAAARSGTGPGAAPQSLATVADDFRIRKALPTIKWLQARGASVRVCSHLGRPEGPDDDRFAIEPVRRRLAELVPGVEVMENVRFDPGETANDPKTVDRLVEGCDLYVNDAFGSCHRSHASIVGPPARLPSAAGRLVAWEVEMLDRVITDPVRPYVVVLGGAKIGDKISLLRALAPRTDAILVGGGMCFSFLAALGHDVGDSLVDPSQLQTCRDIIDTGRRIVVPVDVRALEPGGELAARAGGTRSRGKGKVKEFGRTVPVGWRGMDIGPETEALFADEINGSGTVFWNGPMGVFEDPRFASGTTAVARAVARCGGFTVVGGGDSARALNGLGLSEEIDHLSSGGGASLTYIETGSLPGLDALVSVTASSLRGTS